MNDVSYLASEHDPWIVLASVAVAILASYVTLDLSLKVRKPEGGVSKMWWIAGSLVMGTAVWSMHFVGMLAFSLPIQLGFSHLLTFVSWLAAVAASVVALGVASAGRYSLGSVAGASVAMGAGICGMHYIGMAALDMTPGIVWDWRLVAASAAIAVAASASALMIFRLLQRVHARREFATQALAATVMGAAICGMHYTGMAAASFPLGSVCLSAQELGGRSLAAIVAIATLMLLLGTLLASILEVRLQRVARQLSQSLQESNERLQSANDELLQRALSDPLTGLPNRLLFEDRLRQAVQRFTRSHQSAVVEQLAVLFVDLDGFKPVNDTFGHGAGDQILIASAQRLLAEVRSGDTVARVGGDEFVLLLEGLRDVEACVAVANQILRAFAQPFEVVGRQLRISCSIGIAMHSVQGDAEKLVAHADAAMYAAKRTGGSSLAFFEAHMAIDAADHLQLQSDLRQALEDNQLELYYQPKIHGRRHRMSGLEALVRWNHPRLGVVGPDTFIPLAERFGLIVRLGHWVINEACRQVAAWGNEGRHMRVAVNLSVHQLREVSLVDSVEEALRRHGLLGSQLICEITESVAIQEREITTRIFEGLARIGVHLSIDDFGTGYSSLSQLRDLPARQLKIDRSFVRDIEGQEDARAVVEAVIKLAHALQLTVVAEGVETQGQRDVLLSLGCDELQGYFYARPMRASAVLGWSLDASTELTPAR
ncbi:putative bifunctional diguanylate cyclase/phosphodiesterase [Variovorax saccharolyticus]|uniref:putative bifunctional diguanylate cyclase/phosphodiesterase n=1 Tax=Variovorax saccharolyticus TaxID=3053516 RepID=UPI0025762D30|nr:EAL domain-containing protein [Variovorax sp. J31P216]MDM0029426.1 EAL domain-containing protein [Variovorax sp. J31P216]